MSYEPIEVSYSDSKLRILAEEYITQQKTEFTFKGVCNYILYWAMEDGKTAKAQDSLYQSNELQITDQERVRCVLDTIIRDGRIASVGGNVYRKL